MPEALAKFLFLLGIAMEGNFFQKVDNAMPEALAKFFSLRISIEGYIYIYFQKVDTAMPEGLANFFLGGLS